MFLVGAPAGDEGAAGEGGELAVGVDAEGLHDGAGEGGAHAEVGEGGDGGGDPGEAVDVAEDAGADWGAVGGVVVGQELGLDLGHVDAGGAFGLAGLAGEAEVEDVVGLFAGEGLWVEDAAGEGVAQGVGAAAGGVLLVLGGHVAGAHGAGFELAADGGAVAHLDGAHEAALLGEVQVGF